MIRKVSTHDLNTLSIMEALSSQHGDRHLRRTPSTMFHITSNIKHHTQLRSRRMRLNKHMSPSKRTRKTKRIRRWFQTTDMLLNMAQWQT